jgi:hypothetical protein
LVEKKLVYVSQLPKEKRDAFVNMIKDALVQEGHSEERVARAVQETLDSKIADILDAVRPDDPNTGVKKT